MKTSISRNSRLIAGVVLPVFFAVIGCRSSLDKKADVGENLGELTIDVISIDLTKSVEIGGSPTDQFDGPGPLIFPSVRIEPIDFSTGLGASLPTIFLTASSSPAEDMEAIGDAVFVATWPELLHIPISISWEGDELEWQAVITPTVELADQWYVFGLQSVPQGWVVGGTEYMVPLDPGLGLRFRTGSQPRLWGLSGCNKNNEESSVSVKFTEDVMMTVEAVQIPGCDGAQELGVRGSSRYLDFRCPFMADGTSLVVVVEPGASSETREPLTDAFGNLSFEWALSLEVQSDCWLERAPVCAYSGDCGQ